MRCRIQVATCLLLLGGGYFAAEEAAVAVGSEGVQITKLPDRLRVEINGQLFTEYFFKDVPRPFCYPLIGPGDAAMTRNWPMKTTPDEEHDHPHHRSLWFAHGAVNGHDFWSETKNAGKIVHEGFDQIESGKKMGVIKSRNKWVASDGTVVCTDERILRIYAPTSASGVQASVPAITGKIHAISRAPLKMKLAAVDRTLAVNNSTG